MKRTVQLAGVILAASVFLYLLPDGTYGREAFPYLAWLGILILAGVAWVARHRRAGSSGTIKKWSKRAHKHDGCASRWTLLRTSSKWAVARNAGIYRPSLAELSLWQRLHMPATEYATCLAKVGRIKIWSACEDVTLRVGGPRMGKTSELAGHAIDAPGALITTSTRTDLADSTTPHREKIGPVYVFNPSGVGGSAYQSTVMFNPLTGCADPITALVRAADLVSGTTPPAEHKPSGDGKRWDQKAGDALALLMHAAALGGLSMLHVLRWASNPTESIADVRRLLNRSEPAWAESAYAFLTTNETTRSSVTSSMTPALNWLLDPIAAASAVGDGIDVEEFIKAKGTLHVLDSEETKHTAPLATAFTRHVAREARRLAALSPKGRHGSPRLDPPLTAVLDEATKIPLPLSEWTSDMGGAGVTLHIAVQGLSQLKQRFGEDGAASILNNSATVLVYGGTKDPGDLAEFAANTGKRYELLDPTKPEKGMGQVVVVSGYQISKLPKHRVVIIRNGMPPAIGRTETWKQVHRRKVRDRLVPPTTAQPTAAVDQIDDATLQTEAKRLIDDNDVHIDYQQAADGTPVYCQSDGAGS